MRKRIALFISLLLLPGLACQILSPAGNQPSAPSGTEVALAVEQTLQAATQQANALAPTPPSADQGTATAQPAQPKPGPRSGLQVAYTLDGDLYLWSPGLKSVRLTQHGQVLDMRLSSDGLWAAYTKKISEGHIEIWAVRSDGSGDQLLAGTAQMPSPDPAQTLVPDQMQWVPGSHTLLYNTVVVYAGPGRPASDDLRSVSVDTPEQKTILLPPGQGGHFILSPDRKKLLIVRNDRFLVANIDGSDLRQVFTYPYVMTYSEWAYLPDPVWSTDSKSFRVIIPPQDPLTRPDEPSVLWQVPADGSTAKQVSSFLAAPAFQYRALLSPTGQKLAYQTTKGDAILTDLHLASADQKDHWVVRSGKLRFDSWAPDGLHFAVYISDNNELQVGSTNGSFISLPVGIKPFRLSWVDSQYVLVLSGSIDTPELYLLLLGGRSFRIAASSNPDLKYDFVTVK